MWTDSFIITDICPAPLPGGDKGFRVDFQNEKASYFVYICDNGTADYLADLFPKYRSIPIFTRHSIADVKKIVYLSTKKVDDQVYCSCDGEAKKNWAGGNEFWVCVLCGKEKRR